MDSLRLTLLIIGIAFIAVFYLVMRVQSGKPLAWPRLKWPFKSGKQTRNDDDIPVLEQVVRRDLQDEPDEEDIRVLSRLTLPNQKDEVDLTTIHGLTAIVEDEAYAGDPLVIVFNIMARPGRLFAGLDVLDALYANDMVHGDMQIFHRYLDPANQQHAIYSVANTVEPGFFQLETIEQLRTPGLSLFMQLPGPVQAREAFDMMLKTGRALAEQLGGDLCDETRSVLTVQTIGHLKEKIEAFMFKQKMSRVQRQRH